ncbi:hypothetical protein OVY01_05990 [Robbsia sp. Bb-Pol-6]|uniref:Uncharacterized protein n=1 Tax=Robbsia betulipollinis TaxID=2981849 RepID=A0ABT3ZJU9_9BURK|nr:hypothetical protein [Robbsia betulipollinis]MCY0386791.1 hypothetical protein [Robbsia betulipollinis]
MSSPGTIRLKFVRAEADDPIFSRDYQVGLRHFYDQVRAEGLRMSAVSFTMDRMGGNTGFMGEFVIHLGQPIGPQLADNAAVWMQAREGRLIRIRVGGNEFEADTEEVLRRLLTDTQALRSHGLRDDEGD